MANASLLDEQRRAFFTAGSEFAPVERADIVGIDAMLTRVDGLVEALRMSEALERYGARLEAGVLFEGPPGTGKTLVARYVATVSGALFINVRDFPRKQSELRAQDVAPFMKCFPLLFAAAIAAIAAQSAASATLRDSSPRITGCR